jgi:hypothetical protein
LCVDASLKNQADAGPAPASPQMVLRSPLETITALAARLQLKPITTYALGQEPHLVTEVVNSTGVVLICWEHKAMNYDCVRASALLVI